MDGDEAKRRARAVLVLFLATVAVGLLLLVAFEPEVQTLDPDELVARKDDARAFFAGDFVFVALYGLVSPIAIWRFGAAVAGGSPPWWAKLTVVALGVAALLDSTENALLLSATGSVSEGAVDAAHGVAVALHVVFPAGAVLALAVNVLAARALRRPGR